MTQSLRQSARGKQIDESKGCKNDHDWEACIPCKGDDEVRRGDCNASNNRHHAVSNDSDLRWEQLSDIDIEKGVFGCDDQSDDKEGYQN